MLPKVSPGGDEQTLRHRYGQVGRSEPPAVTALRVYSTDVTR
jgi:hypothetical protein